MQKFFILAWLGFIPILTYSQRSMDGLINAEKSFAAYSVVHGTKDAFLKFADSTGIVFDNGNPVNAIETWNKKEEGSGILNWFPQYAAISNSKDFGFTSGPWTYRVNDSVIARGQYSTVWHINKNGEWKFLMDLGVNNTPAEADTKLYADNRKSKQSSLKSLLVTEEKFIQASHDSSIHAYNKFIDGFSILNRNNRTPQTSSWELNTFPVNPQYVIIGSAISQSKDLAYVYGNSTINGKKDNYLRVWKNYKRGGWKVIMEVLRY